MEVNKVVNGVTALQKLYAQDLSLATTLKIVQNSEEFDKVLKIFNEKLTKLREEFNADEATDEETASLEEHAQAVLKEDIDITVKTFTLEELTDVKLSASDLKSILWLIEDA